MKVSCEHVVIVSASLSHSRALKERVKYLSSRCLRGYDHGEALGQYWACVLFRPDTTASQIQEVIREVQSPTIKVVKGLTVWPNGRTHEQAQTLAEHINNLPRVEVAHTLGITQPPCFAAVVPPMGADMDQLKRDIEALASKLN